MKKFLFLGAMAAMLLGTASCSNEMEPEMTDGTVQFKVELPGNIDSRAISDGTTATELDVACYDADGNYIPTLVAPTTITITPFNERVATVTMKLVKGQKYQFAFFAHADGAPYAFNAGTKLSECNFTVNDNYTGTACVSNAENRDAFYATLTNYEVTTATTPVELHRPFAQLNFGTDDLAAAQAAGITPGQSMVTVKQVATSFNLSTGATTGAVDATFALAAHPTEKLVVDKEYDWMAMNYFLVPNNEANVDVKMTVKTNKADVEVPVTSVPVKKNHRTNILGSLFTQEGKFNVIIDQNFDEPDLKPEVVWDGTMTEPADITGDIIEIKDGGELAWVLNSITNGTTLAGKTFKLTDDINLGKKDWPLVNAQCAFTLDGNNKTIKGLKSTGGNYGGLIGRFSNQAQAALIKDLTIADSEIDATGRTGDDNAAGAFIGWSDYGTTYITLENCVSKNVKLGKAQYNGGLVGYSSNMIITNCSVIECEILSDYAENGDYKGHSGCAVGYGNQNSTITNTRVADTQITGRNDKNRVGIFYGSAQSSVTIGTGNSVKNVIILGNPATSANLVGAVDNRSDKSNDGTVVFE